MGKPLRLRRYVFGLGTAWTVVISASLGWNLLQMRHDLLERARMEARGSSDKDLLLQRWAAGHGGVYVPATDETPPNPNLAHINERDIETPSGRRLTLMNAAYMMRQLYSKSRERHDLRGHFTSLKPIRPGNAPDPWERTALEAFERGETEVSAVEKLDGKSYMRLMRPMITEVRCLKCHAEQGYKVGDVRGGFSVSVPLSPYLAQIPSRVLPLILGHGFIWILGLLGLVVFARTIRARVREREQAEDAVRRSEERYRAVSELTSDFAYALRMEEDGRLVSEWVTGALAQITGFTADEIRARGGWESLVAPEDKAIAQRQRQSLLAGEASTVEYRILSKNGEVRWMRDRAHPLWDKERGRVTHILGAVEDVTERTQAELDLRSSYETVVTILESIDAEVYVSDLQTYEILFMNKKMRESFGDDLVGKTCWKEFRHESQPCPHCTNPKLVDTGGRPTGVQVWEGYNPVSQRWYINHDRAVRWLDGRLVRLQVSTDITERKKMESELRKAEKLESIGVLAGGIAHDFNNLLMGIMGNISLARLQTKPGTQVFELLEQTEQASARATSLTKQLLTFAKGGEPILKATSMAGILEESAEFALRGSNVKSDLAVPEDLWPAEVDAGQISHVFHNLVLNANQAMPDGGTLRIRAKNVEVGPDHALRLTPGRYVAISVQDEGAGIPPDHLSKVFDPYFTTKQSGTGLGLATAYSIVQKHSGDITVDSPPGGGTTFRVYLPASDKDLPRAGPAMEVPVVGKGRILIMDDEEAVRDVALGMIQALGYDGVGAGDGGETIELYRQAEEGGQPFEAVVLDLTVRGGMGGKETVRHLLELDPGVRAIVSSGYSTDPVMSDFEQHGFKGVVAKPYRVSELSEALRRVIREE